MRERPVGRTLSAVTSPPWSLKPSLTPLELIRSCSLPCNSSFDSSRTTIDILSLQALHYQQMGLDFNVASSGDNQEVRKATSVCSDATESTGDTTAIQMEHRSQTSSLLRRNSGKQEPDSDPQTLQGVLGMIENAVYPYCSNDTSFTSSCRISSGQGDILTGTGSARATSTPITCNTSGAAEILVDFESTTCKTVENSIDETGSEFRENVEIHETAGKVENESKDMEFRDNGQLYSPSLALQPIRRQSIKEQDQKQAEPQNMTHAHRHTSPSLCQIPGLRISAATHISDSQPTQTDEKHDQACSPDRGDSKFQEAVSPGYPNAQPVVKPQPNPAEQECLTLAASEDNMAASSSNVDLQSRELSAEPAHASSPAPEHAPINASQIHIAQETSKSSSRTFVESDNAQREGVQPQRSNSDRGFTHHRTPASGPIVFHDSNPDLEPHPIYVLPDKFSEPVSVMDQTQERSRKRAYADVQPSEGSRKKQRLEIINQKCMSQLFPFGKDDGYTQHICEPSRSITSSTLLLQKPQQQMDAKGSTHADGIAAGRKTYPFNLQDEQRKTRKTFSMPIPEYSLFYATPKASFSSVARMKKPYLAKCGSFNPRECRDDEMAGFIRERSIGKLEGMSPNLTSKVVSRDACTAVQVSSSIIANATWGPSSTKVGKLDSVTITRTSSAALPRQEQAGISVEQESSQQSVVLEASIEQRVREEAQRLPPDSGRPKEKDWKRIVELPPKSEDDNDIDHDDPSRNTEEERNNVFIAKRPLVLFTKFRRPQKVMSKFQTTSVPPKLETSPSRIPVSPSSEASSIRKLCSELYPRGRQARALERLKQPFRSPMMNDDKLRLLLRPSTNDSELATLSTTDSASSYTQLEGVVDQQQITVQNQTGPQYLHSERIVTERLASSFSSPFSSPFKDIEISPSASAGSSVAYLAKKRTVKAIVHPKEDHTSSRISLSGEIAELERRKQILRQAIKIQRDPQEQHLRELVSQWKQAGRDIVEMLYPIVPHPETQGHSNRIATSSWGTAPNDASSCGYETTQRTQEDAEVEDLKDWNYGTMMLSLQVDPQLLDWDEEAEDWEMQC